MKKNVSGQVVVAQLNSKTDGSAITSGTTTCYVLGDGGTQAAGSVGSGACTHEGNGVWSYFPAQAETNYDHVAFTFVNTSAVNATVQIYTSFPQSADAPTAVQNADTLLDRDMATGTDSGGRTVRNALRFLRNKWTLTGTTLSVKKEDDSTEAWSSTVTTGAGAEPVTGNDPA